MLAKFTVIDSYRCKHYYWSVAEIEVVPSVDFNRIQSRRILLLLAVTVAVLDHAIYKRNFAVTLVSWSRKPVNLLNFRKFNRILHHYLINAYMAQWHSQFIFTYENVRAVLVVCLFSSNPLCANYFTLYWQMREKFISFVYFCPLIQTIHQIVAVVLVVDHFNHV